MDQQNIRIVPNTAGRDTARQYLDRHLKANPLDVLAQHAYTAELRLSYAMLDPVTGDPILAPVKCPAGNFPHLFYRRGEKRLEMRCLFFPGHDAHVNLGEAGCLEHGPGLASGRPDPRAGPARN